MIEELPVNLLLALNEGFKEVFLDNSHVIGASEIPFGYRKWVINKREGLTLDDSMTLLTGKITHGAWQKERVMLKLTKAINKELNIEEKVIQENRFVKLEDKWVLFEVEKELYKLIKISEGRFIRLHTDIWSTLYSLEFKTTSMPIQMWSTLAPYHIMQLNTYLGFSKQKYGFLLKMDIGCLKGECRHGGFLQSKAQWKRLWNSYFRLYKVMFSQKLFDYTIKRANQFFTYLETDTNLKEIPCPLNVFECTDKCRNYCPNPLEKVKMEVSEKCFHCGRLIEQGTTALIRNGNIYHYTYDKQHVHDKCVKACLDAWRCK